ncbi:MAG TPA: PDGLE domain-containing protein [Armatimonadota bacterium]|nr:PDGLE domain-containing protein [Armatimonadota bacterium]
MKTTAKLWIALLVLVALSPLGIIVAAKLGAETAWGEWGADEVRDLVGYLPAQMARLSGRWRAPLPDYALPGQENASLPALSGSYILSAVMGVAVIVAVTLLIGRVLARRDQSNSA